MAWDSVHLFECPTRVFYGAGAAQEVGARLQELGASRPLLVTDQGLRRAGSVDHVAEHAHGAGVDVVVYDETAANPTTTNLEEIRELYASNNCDSLIGLGGGSSMDAAKAASALIENGGSIWDYRGKDLVPRPGPPVVCLPTTCGTGADVTFVVVITDPAEHFKVVCAARNLAARVAIVDPNLVMSAPAKVIAATGVDALAHATESYVNTGSDPVLDALNIRAITMIGRSLRAAVKDKDADAIAEMALASTMTGIAFNMNANAIVHAASTPVTAHYNVPHGVANAIFLAEGLDILRPACERKLGEIAAALGENVSALTQDVAARRGIEAIRTLCSDIGLPGTLRAWGLDPADVDIPTLVVDAMKSRNIATNPLPIGAVELEQLYAAVLG
jgi:alcohol dehydrogenase